MSGERGRKPSAGSVVTVLEKGDAERFEKRSWSEGFFILMVLVREVGPSKGESGFLKNGMDFRRLLGDEGKLSLLGKSTGSPVSNDDRESSNGGCFIGTLDIVGNRWILGEDEGVAGDSVDVDGVGSSGGVAVRASGFDDVIN